MAAGDVPRPRRKSRRQAPAHITLPPATFTPSGASTSSPMERFKHTFPSTPGIYSLTPAHERPNPFFLLNEETPPAPVHSLSPPSRAPKTPPAVPRRPALPPQVSLEHAFGVVRATMAGRKDDPLSGTTADPACSPRSRTSSSGRPHTMQPLSAPSPSPSSRSPSRCEVRSQPDVSEVKKKKKKTRERMKSAPEKVLETPSFRSSAAGTPTAGTPRNISISEIPMFGNNEFRRPEDVFGLAAVQPPRWVSRRPMPLRRQTVHLLSSPVELCSELDENPRKAASCKGEGSRRNSNDPLSLMDATTRIQVAGN